jgi:hypothetical protein
VPVGQYQLSNCTHQPTYLVFFKNSTAIFQAECEREVNVDEDTPGGVQIKAHNITKVAAELLMDFS